VEVKDEQRTLLGLERSRRRDNITATVRPSVTDQKQSMAFEWPVAVFHAFSLRVARNKWKPRGGFPDHKCAASVPQSLHGVTRQDYAQRSGEHSSGLGGLR
jgi:hypothetical protein